MDFNTLSSVLLWIVVIVQSVIIYALLRQVGVLFERVAPAGALAMNQKLKVGQVAPEMTLQTLDNQLINIAGLERQKSQLLFFMSPDCPVCKSLLPALRAAAKDESHWIEVILASDGNTVDHKQFVKDYKLTKMPYVVSEILGKSYGVAKLPYGVVINEQGEIASMGILNSREHLDSLFEAKEKKIASIQDYMQSQNNDSNIVEAK